MEHHLAVLVEVKVRAHAEVIAPEDAVDVQDVHHVHHVQVNVLILATAHAGKAVMAAQDVVLSANQAVVMVVILVVQQVVGGSPTCS